MERDAHYFWVGVFVLGMAIAGMLFAGLFYKNQPHAVYQAYEIRFDSPIEGLDKGSDVRYMGIKVGEVSTVFIVPENPALIGVTIRVQAATPVTTATVATLRLQGLTGQPFINLGQKAQSPAHAPPLVAARDGTLAVIPTQPSDLDALLKQLPDLEIKLGNLLDAANDLLNPQNRAHVSQILQKVDTAASELPALMQHLAQTTQQLNGLIAQASGTLKRTEKGVNANLQALQTTLIAIRQTAQQLDKLTRDVDRVVTSNELQIDAIVSEGGASLNQLLREARQAATSLRQLSDQLQRNPSQLIYQPPAQGTELPP